MSRRFIAPWRDSATKPELYHRLSRVMDRRFVFKAAEREHFRMFMRMYENFSGCRVLSYCIVQFVWELELEAGEKRGWKICDREAFGDFPVIRV